MIDLPRHPVVHGHPIHAILSDGPAVLIPVALATEAWRRRRNDTATQLLSGVATRLATAAAAAAGVVGWIDWLTIPGEHPARTPATIHGVINTPASSPWSVHRSARNGASGCWPPQPRDCSSPPGSEAISSFALGGG